MSDFRRDINRMAGRKSNKTSIDVPDDLKETLRRRAAAEHRTLSQEITRILTEAVQGKTLPPGAIDRRTGNSTPHRRATDPPERRRRDDLPLALTSASEGGEQLVAKVPGKARRHFGAWDSGDERSADNERIDHDLAREYGNL
jgi:plasmid stability protein